jgi:hypothetical protein
MDLAGRPAVVSRTWQVIGSLPGADMMDGSCVLLMSVVRG